MIISGVTITTCDIPLPRPIVMGKVHFASREYVLVEVRTDEGVLGTGFGMTRNGQVAATIERNIAPYLIGRDPFLVQDIWQDLYYRNLTIGQQGLYMRALSAVDIALWDIKGRAAGQPIWQLIGGLRHEVPGAVAGAYETTVDPGSLKRLEAEVSGYVDDGYRLIKIAAGDATADLERLGVAADTIAGRGRLAYDGHWVWRSVDEIATAARTWETLDLAFVEDPFPSAQTGLIAGLRKRSRVALALGEDLAGRWAFKDLLERWSPEILRVDATAAGGLSEALIVCALAAAFDTPVLPHVFPEVHVHLGAAFPIVMAVELTEPRQELEGLYRLFDGWVERRGGMVIAPAGPGLGYALDQAAVNRYSTAQASVAG